MAQDEARFVLVHPDRPTPGALIVAVPSERANEMDRLQKERQMRFWKVRAVISDHVPLAGSLDDALRRPSYNQLILDQSPLTFYLHRGGHDATYFDFAAENGNRLSCIQVRVETDLPSNAFFFSKGPLNEMLDVFTRREPLTPLVIQRLELLSPDDGLPIAYELVMPYEAGFIMGRLGGIGAWPPFAPYAAIFREALTTSSPFYRLLCACRVYEGSNSIRRWLKEQRARFNIHDRLPSDPEVDSTELQGFGFNPAFAKDIKKARDLFEKLGPHRNGIAHFLVQGKERDFHMYLADPQVISEYWIGSTALLKYAHLAIRDLQKFYVDHISGRLRIGHVLPMLEYRDEFDIRPHRAR